MFRFQITPSFQCEERIQEGVVLYIRPMPVHIRHSKLRTACAEPVIGGRLKISRLYAIC